MHITINSSLYNSHHYIIYQHSKHIIALSNQYILTSTIHYHQSNHIFMLKLTIYFIDVLESTQRVLLKFHEKCNMTPVHYFNNNSNYRNPNGVKPKENER